MTDDQRMRPSAEEIYDRVKKDAEEELQRKSAGLAFSGLLAGATLGIGGIVLAAVQTSLGSASSAYFVASLAYPIGFLAVILGRAQFFTENTLYPVALAIDEPRYRMPTVRIWVVVFLTNTIGALLFALLAVKTGAFPAGASHEFAKFGEKIVAGPFIHNFWSAVVAGWLLALVAWLVEATEVAIGQAAVIWTIAFALAILQLDHSVASTPEVLGATIDGSLGLGRTVGWLGTALLGNLVGGVGIVALLNYGQVRAGD